VSSAAPKRRICCAIASSRRKSGGYSTTTRRRLSLRRRIRAAAILSPLAVHAHRPDAEEHWALGKRIQAAFRDMGVLEFASLNPEEGMRADESEALRLEQELRKDRAA
jgi:hypothetical protein